MLDLLKAAKAKIVDIEHWCQFFPARTTDNKTCPFKSEMATKWCAAGAIWSSHEDIGLTRDTLTFLQTVAKDLPEANDFSVFEINDKLGHEMVMKLFDLAISRLEA